MYPKTQVTNSEKACRFPKCVASVRVGTAPSVRLEDGSCARRGRCVAAWHTQAVHWRNVALITSE